MKYNKQKKEHKSLAELVYHKAIREQIMNYYKSKYEKRINYLVGANNQLMRELEECERECYGRGY